LSSPIFLNPSSCVLVDTGDFDVHHQKNPSIYQLDFTTPGSFPCEANSRKQILQIPNFRMKALGLPQIGHLLYPRTLNFGFAAALFLSAVFAKSSSLVIRFRSRWCSESVKV
jgi:hypothetical protein